jgi:hypothetical protein
VSRRHAAESPDVADDLAGGSAPAEAAPVLRVVAGDPTPDELAAVTALLAALQAGRPSSPVTTPSRSSGSAWTRSARAPRVAVVPGAGHWRGFAG